MVRISRFLLASCLVASTLIVHAQEKRVPADNTKKTDASGARKYRVKRGQLVVLRKSSFVAKRDTTITVEARDVRFVRIQKNPSAIAAMFYDSLAQRASSGKVTKDVFDMVVRKRGSKERLVNSIIVSEDIFKPFEGFIINSVSVKTIDVLEGSVIDTLQKATTKLGVFVNRVHRDTKVRLVQRYILFSAGEKVDPYKLADNERVLRQFRPLRDARIYLSKSRKDRNAVDIVVAVQDVASFGFSGMRRSWQDFRFDIFNVNIRGTGAFAGISYFRNEYYTPTNGWEFNLAHPNLFGSFVKGGITYANNFIHERIGIAFSRDYFTPEIKVGGGLSYYQTAEHFYIDGYDTLRTPYNETSFEIWGGRSFQIRKRTNIIVNALLNPRSFYNRPFVSEDSNIFLHDRTLIAGNIWLVKRNYLKSLRVRGFGRTEDIPIGAGAGLMYGRELNEFGNRDYFQIEFTAGKYFNRIGYVNAAIAGGSFFRSGRGEDGQLSFNATGFSDLIRLRRTQLRNFLFFEATYGFNRQLDRSLILAGKWRDESGNIPIGTRRVSVGAEADYFMPWYVYGFQFTVYCRGDVYFLTMDDLLSDSSVFYSLKGGVRTLNENLVLPSFSIELGYYGKSSDFPAAWQIRFLTNLPDLFPGLNSFKPQVKTFDSQRQLIRPNTL